MSMSFGLALYRLQAALFYRGGQSARIFVILPSHGTQANCILKGADRSATALLLKNE